MKQKTTLPVIGMDCASCANIVNRTLKKTPGVITSQVNLATEKATIEFDSKQVSLKTLAQNVKKAGYRLDISGKTLDPNQKLIELANKKKEISFLFPISLFVFLFMSYESLTDYLTFLPKAPFSMEIHKITLFTLATLFLFIFGQVFLKAIWRFIQTKNANMDTLVGIGSLVAYLYSSFVYLFPSLSQSLGLPANLYFDVPIVIIGFIKYGKYLEANSKQRTGDAIKRLLELSSKTALVERNGKEIEIPIDQVVQNDILIIKPGAKIPVDGLIVSGSTSIDESMITGESMPVDKTKNDSVIGGTINKQGSFTFKATKIGKDTLLSQIITLVESAQGSKAPIEKLADVISSVFVPTVLGISLITLLAWLGIGSYFMPFSQALAFGLSAFVGILVIACPCALGLATPTAIIVGVGKGAQNGILVKDAESLEKVHSVTTIVIDKTGTITKGTPEVVNIISNSDLTKDKILSRLYSLEKHSEHPLATAIVNFAKSKKLKPKSVVNFKNLEGKGITGKILGKTYFASNATLLKDKNIPYDAKQIKDYTSQGKTPVFLSDGKKLLGTIFIADTLKPNAVQTIKDLHQQKLKVVMLTGDDQDTANHIAKQAGIDQVVAQVLPTEKSAVIKKLKDEGEIVAMVGDGVNDAPALALADIGIAMGTGTDVAIESANITLLHGDLAKVLQAIKLSRATMRTIKQNLFWAFIYNIVGIPVAAGALYPLLGIFLNPVFAGLAMAFSSVSVVTNSLRLKSAKI